MLHAVSDRIMEIGGGIENKCGKKLHIEKFEVIIRTTDYDRS